MKLICKKELNSLLTSPIGYVFLAAFFLISGWYFYIGNLFYATSDLTAVFSSLYNICLYIIPILTMRLFSEEKKHKTDILLLTSPLSPAQIAVGKLLSSFLFFALAMSVTICFGICLSIMTQFNWALFFCQFTGALLLGFSFIAISSFFASFTENQIVAAISSIVALFLFHLSDSFITMTTNTTLQRIFTGFSPLKNYSAFASGTPSLQNLLYFLSVGLLFTYFTVFSVKQQTNR